MGTDLRRFLKVNTVTRAIRQALFAGRNARFNGQTFSNREIENLPLQSFFQFYDPCKGGGEIVKRGGGKNDCIPPSVHIFRYF